MFGHILGVFWYYKRAPISLFCFAWFFEIAHQTFSETAQIWGYSWYINFGASRFVKPRLSEFQNQNFSAASRSWTKSQICAESAQLRESKYGIFKNLLFAKSFRKIFSSRPRGIFDFTSWDKKNLDMGKCYGLEKCIFEQISARPFRPPKNEKKSKMSPRSSPILENWG